MANPLHHFSCLSAHLASDEMLALPLPDRWNGEITFRDAADGGLAIFAGRTARIELTNGLSNPDLKWVGWVDTRENADLLVARYYGIHDKKPLQEQTNGQPSLALIADIAEYAVLKGLTFFAATKVLATFGYSFIKNEISANF